MVTITTCNYGNQFHQRKHIRVLYINFIMLDIGVEGLLDPPNFEKKHSIYMCLIFSCQSLISMQLPFHFSSLLIKPPNQLPYIGTTMHSELKWLQLSACQSINQDHVTN